MQLDGTKFKIFLKNIFKYLPQRRMRKKKKEKKKEPLTKNEESRMKNSNLLL
jgi:hypothetical protein